ncbi:MAG: response regulator, partial [Microcoleaceae cyanobacterium]
FTPFFQAQAGLTSPEGTGLGLAISQKYVQFFGGKLKVDSEVGVGTTFQFEIQFTSCTFPNLETQYLNTSVVALAKDQPSYRILIVDDLPNNRQLLEQLLAPLGFETREASNGREAIAVCQEFQPHLILMDMKMPVMDGYEATRQIKSWAKAQVSILKPKIIALTASALNQQKTEALAVGCDDFVSKPLETTVILEKIAEHIGVRYVFQDSTEEELSTAPESDRAPEQLLKVMSQEWQEKLADACISLNSEEIEILIAEIPPGNSTLANLLYNYAYNFAYDQILHFLESVN